MFHSSSASRRESEARRVLFNISTLLFFFCGSEKTFTLHTLGFRIVGDDTFSAKSSETCRILKQHTHNAPLSRRGVSSLVLFSEPGMLNSTKKYIANPSTLQTHETREILFFFSMKSLMWHDNNSNNTSTDIFKSREFFNHFLGKYT